MGKCCVPYCKGLGTFSFPRDEKRRAAWGRALGFRCSTSSRSKRLCALHFDDNDIIENRESYWTGVRSSRRMLKSDAIPSRMLYLQPEIPGSCIKIRIRKPLFKADSLSASKSLGDDKEFLCSETFQECSMTETSPQNFEQHNKLTLSESNDGNILEETNLNLESSLSKFIEKEQNNYCQEIRHSETSLNNNEQSDLILELADFYSNFCMQVEEKETLTIYPSDDLSSNEPTVIIDTTSSTN